MPGTFGTTARNALRFLKGTSLVSDVDEGFEALANDVDSKMASYSQGTLGARPPAGQANRFYKATDTGVIFHDTGTLWEPVMPGLAVRTSAGSTTAVSGERVEMTATGTVTLPAVTVNSVVEVWNAEGVTTIVGAGAAKISGDFVSTAASITLTKFQHVLLVADGGGWLIVAGEPKREQVMTRTLRTSGTAWTPSSTRPTQVTVEAIKGTLGGYIALAVECGGTTLNQTASGAIGGGGEYNPSVSITIWVQPGETVRGTIAGTGIASAKVESAERPL